MTPIDSNVIVAILSCAGTIIGSAFGVFASQKLTRHRIEQLEKKVDKHNQLIERTAILEEKVKVINHRIDGLEHTIK
ncbi:hypothetical protein [Scatolibacter rhodanostii]|uniref:hypothetical protein n=1 Tax=Scatolibacter rhodanostii TaxID=2014781 RepID=UPI00278BB62C|nr:hypothetical protein [Scatolibacter rhodanostii]